MSLDLSTLDTSVPEVPVRILEIPDLYDLRQSYPDLRQGYSDLRPVSGGPKDQDLDRILSVPTSESILLQESYYGRWQ